jgi:hypothetical protein
LRGDGFVDLEEVEKRKAHRSLKKAETKDE